MFLRRKGFRVSRTGVAKLDWKTPCEVEFGKNADDSCLKHKFYYLVRACDTFMNVPNHRHKNSRSLGESQESGDELTLIVEVNHEGKKLILVRSVIQAQFPEGHHPPRVRLKIASSILFQDPVSRN